MRVGTRKNASHERFGHWDHPHACGDKPRLAVWQADTLGSSPCVWGQVNGNGFPDTLIRIIPMRVGTRAVPLRERLPAWDHPHACGDKPGATFSDGTKPGSSPCVWGQEIGGASTAKCDRIIPMRVGTRTLRSFASCVVKDHPHACGDKALCCCALVAYSVSSPCVWGQAREKHRPYQYAGIIPMRVGTRIADGS